MTLFSSILSEIIVMEVDASNGTTSMTVYSAKYSPKKSGIILQEIDNKKEDWPQKKKGVVVMFISGSDVGSKEYEAPDNDSAKKITDNNNLLWTIHEENGNSRIDFIRKSSLENVLNVIENKHLYIIDSTVSQQADLDIQTRLQQFFENKLDFDLVKKSKELRGFFFDSLFDKIKLPVLLFFFVLLFVNYILFSNIKEKYDISEATYSIQLQKTKFEKENSEKTNRIFGEYNKIQSYPLALISDRIASFLPKDVRLTTMIFFPENKTNLREKDESDTRNVIIVKGKAEIAGTVLLFAQYLEEDKLFSKVDIININNLKDIGSYDFELQLTL